MGVSKQAAQQRFVPKAGPAALDPSQGFSRFTDRARAVVVRAREEVREAGNETIGVADLGLAADQDSTAAGAISAQGISLDDVRRIAVASLPARSEQRAEFIPFDAHARRALELTFGEALRLGSDRIGTGHVLLAVLEAEDGTGVLAGLGIDKPAVEAYVSAAQGRLIGRKLPARNRAGCVVVHTAPHPHPEVGACAGWRSWHSVRPWWPV